MENDFDGREILKVEERLIDRKSVLVAAVNVEADPGSRLLISGSPRLREATCFVAVKGQKKGNGDIRRFALKPKVFAISRDSH